MYRILRFHEIGCISAVYTGGNLRKNGNEDGNEKTIIRMLDKAEYQIVPR